MTSDKCWRSLSRSVSFSIISYSAFDIGQSLARSIVSNCRHCKECCCSLNTCSRADGSYVCLQLSVCRDNKSAMTCSSTGFHFTENVYLCRASIVACVLFGAASNDLCHIRVAKNVLIELVHGEYYR